jgi:hypothetical protein
MCLGVKNVKPNMVAKASTRTEEPHFDIFLKRWVRLQLEHTPARCYFERSPLDNLDCIKTTFAMSL